MDRSDGVVYAGGATGAGVVASGTVDDDDGDRGADQIDVIGDELSPARGPDSDGPIISVLSGSPELSSR